MNNRKYIYIACCLAWLMVSASVTGQTFGTTYQSSGFTSYEPVTMPAASMSGSVGASQMYMGTTSLPQSEISEPFAASSPSCGLRKVGGPGGGGSGGTDVKDPDIAPVGDGLVALLLFAILFAVGKGVAMRAKKRAL